ncbi:hypothetical protein B0J13DRAFT_530058 [Dactylonectria estremocensis]|uniref:Ecp2 effector protein-like domain-containing protein n=1 Tax=Dactylonectria estremocensis TaxID=1079267 RepID=A0A9P9E3L2_9HYPO|nr:hypothetical protein B0J13DRAFT_530058 [Dactylonectria estremocensis]
MRFIANSVVLAALLTGFVSAAPAYTTTAAASDGTTTTTAAVEHGPIIVSTVLTCGSVATATSLAVDDTPAYWTPTAHHQKACDAASFDEASTDNPVNAADWNDCASLYSEWSSYNGTFTTGYRNATKDDNTSSYDYPATKRDIPAVDYIPVMQSDSCTFALKPDSLDHLLVMGDVDISEILKEALNGYSSGMMLGVRGSTNCAIRGGGQGVKAALEWQLYYPGA